MENKKRNSNFTCDEKRILTELVLKYQSCVENKKTDATTNAQKINGWIRLANEFNSISSHCHRSYPSLRTCWDNIKRVTKKENANRKKEMFKTGGGLPPAGPSNEGQNIVEAILGPAVEGLSNDYDSDRMSSSNLIILDTNSEILDISTDGISTKIEQSSQSQPPEKTTTCSSDTKDNNIFDDPIPTASNCIVLNDGNIMGETDINGQIAGSSTTNDLNCWINWTPKTLKRPLNETLRVVNEDQSSKRRRPRYENLSDELMRKKIELVEVMKKKAEEEADLRILILKEQLKQQQITTQRMSLQE